MGEERTAAEINSLRRELTETLEHGISDETKAHVELEVAKHILARESVLVKCGNREMVAAESASATVSADADRARLDALDAARLRRDHFLYRLAELRKALRQQHQQAE